MSDSWFTIWFDKESCKQVIPGMQVRFKQPLRLLVDRPINGGLACDEHLVPSGTVVEYVRQYYWGSDPGPGFPMFRHGKVTGWAIPEGYDWGCFKHNEVEVVCES